MKTDGGENLMYTVPLLVVSNMQRSLEFYVEKLGFLMINSWAPRDEIEWCLLKRESIRLMLQEPVTKGGRSAFPTDPVGVGVFIYIICKDALAVYEEVIRKNVVVAEPIVGNSMWVISFRDPDNYCIQFESETSDPEEMRYSEVKRSV